MFFIKEDFYFIVLDLFHIFTFNDFDFNNEIVLEILYIQVLLKLD